MPVELQQAPLTHGVPGAHVPTGSSVSCRLSSVVPIEDASNTLIRGLTLVRETFSNLGVELECTVIRGLYTSEPLRSGMVKFAAWISEE